MALQTLKALWASGDKFPITTLTFNLTLGFKYNGQPWSAASTENKILRYALSQSDVTLDGEVYFASCFSAALPERSDNTFQDLTFSIGDVNREILQYLSRITRNDHKNLNFVTLAQWHPTTLQKEFEIEMVINSVNFSGSAANFTASFADLVNTEFPQKRYTAENAPGIIYVSN